MVIMATSKTSEKTGKFTPQGVARSLTSQKYSTPLAVKSGLDVVKMSQNVYLAQQLDNLESQLFSAEPTLTVYDADQNKDIELSKRFENMFLKAGLERSMHVTFLEYMLYGCSVKTFGFEAVKGVLELTEIRDLPADTFWNSPEKKTNYETPNPLMAGLTVDMATGVLTAEQCIGTNNNRIQIKNFKVFKEPSAPEPFGQAYCLPLYPVIAQLDEADKALSKQIQRVGTPLIFPKLKDESVENVDVLNQWASRFLRKWGDNSGFLIPRGVELVAPNIYESTGASERIAMLKDTIGAFFNPTIVLRHAETGIGGSDAGAEQIYYNFLKYTQRWVSKCYEEICESLLAYAGYIDFTARIELPSCRPQNTAQVLTAIQTLMSANAITKEEIRRNVTILDLDEWSPELEAKLEGNTQISEPQNETEAVEEPEKEQANTNPNVIPEEIAQTPKEAENEGKQMTVEANKKADAVDIVNANSISEILKLMKGE